MPQTETRFMSTWQDVYSPSVPASLGVPLVPPTLQQASPPRRDLSACLRPALLFPRPFCAPVVRHWRVHGLDGKCHRGARFDRI